MGTKPAGVDTGKGANEIVASWAAHPRKKTRAQWEREALAGKARNSTVLPSIAAELNAASRRAARKELKARKLYQSRQYWEQRARTAENALASLKGGKPAAGPTFYESDAWRTLRYKALQLHGRACQLCGATGRLHVDHIKPRSRYPELELTLSNLQILCADCNMGKGAWDDTDWRKGALKSIPGD